MADGLKREDVVKYLSQLPLEEIQALVKEALKVAFVPYRVVERYDLIINRYQDKVKAVQGLREALPCHALCPYEEWGTLFQMGNVPTFDSMSRTESLKFVSNLTLPANLTWMGEWTRDERARVMEILQKYGVEAEWVPGYGPWVTEPGDPFDPPVPCGGGFPVG